MSMDHLLEDFYIQLEETRNKLSSCRNLARTTSSHVFDFHSSLESIYRTLQCMIDAIPVTLNDDECVFSAMLKNCTKKAIDLSFDMLTFILHDGSNDDAKMPIVDDGLECQQAIANMIEIAFRICYEERIVDPGECNVISSITEKYNSYQRAVLRQRSKPSISNLANLRKIAKVQNVTIDEFLDSTMERDTHGTQAESDREKWPHANAITVILGEASSLIHPLLVWKEALLETLAKDEEPIASNSLEKKSRLSSLESLVQSSLVKMCDSTLSLLHKEAQNLSIKVGEWFMSDISTKEILSDSNLDQMAFICQVLHRYSCLTSDLKSIGEEESHIQQHLAEQIFRYSTAETNFLRSNVDKAIEIAQPIQIIMGADRYVPSVVEDAYYVSQRSLERASSTLSSKTIVLVVNAVVDIWGSEGGIYNALCTKRGCLITMIKGVDGKSHVDGAGAVVNKAPNSGLKTFLDALEMDIKTSSTNATAQKSDSSSYDSHGGVPLDTIFCLLNGIHAAASACEGLCTLFDSVSLNDTAPAQAAMMITAKEQMQSHKKSYTLLLETQIDILLEDWMGKVHSTENPPPLIASFPQAPPMHRFFYYISNENYTLNAKSLQEAEERSKHLTIPFENSRLVNEIQSGKCDDQVTFKILQAISHQISQLFLRTLFHQKKKQFTEWGTLLLAKQIRVLEEYFCSHVVRHHGNTHLILQEFKKLSQTLAISQLTNPQDYAFYKNSIGTSCFDLEQYELQSSMNLRSDWNEESVLAALNHDTKPRS